jgi:hypothetical protein
MWWVAATILFVWFVACAVAQLNTRSGRWLLSHDTAGLWPSWHFFENVSDANPRILVRICDPFGEVFTKWADAVAPPPSHSRAAFFNPRSRFSMFVRNYRDAIALGDGEGMAEPAVRRLARDRLHSLGEWSVVELFENAGQAASLHGMSIQVAVIDMRQFDADLLYVSQPMPIRLPVKAGVG